MDLCAFKGGQVKNTLIEIYKNNIAPTYLFSMETFMKENKINSPIEQLLFLTLNLADNFYNLSIQPYERIKIFPQFKIGKYRVDFVVKGDANEVIVECDSQEWHERTEKQRRAEKERDRYLQTKGYSVFRYTGKEIMEDTFLVALDILQHVISNDLTGNIKKYAK